MCDWDTIIICILGLDKSLSHAKLGHFDSPLSRCHKSYRPLKSMSKISDP